MIYLDNCATTSTDPEVAQLAAAYMQAPFGNPSSLHHLGAEAYQALGIARSQLAKVLGARPERVYFTACGTESDNLAILGAVHAAGGGHVVTTAIEHDAVLNACRRLEAEGSRVTYVRPDPATGLIRAGDIADAVTEDTVLVSAMFVNNETGEVLPIREIAAAVRARNPKTLIHCDCVQGFGKLPFKLHEFDVDMVSASAHKLHGPKGIGMLYLRDRSMVEPLEFGGGQEGGLRPGTESVPLACAFGLAADRALYGLTERMERAARIKAYLTERLRQALPQLRINSPPQASPYILNISLPGFQSHQLVRFLSLQEIYVSAGSACTRGARSHVLTAMGLPGEQADSALRIGLSKYSTEAEMDALTEALQEFCCR